MELTTKKAFEIFMKNSINLDSVVVNAARKSRDNLLENISEFSSEEDFFNLCKIYNFHFGSFARKTKCRELDDIDLMIGISGDGAKYNASNGWNDVIIYASDTNNLQQKCMDEDGTLNSRKVANAFKKKLQGVREYSRSEIRRNGEAIVLNLVSKDWSFDVVPCFHTTVDDSGKSYYLIPNGVGRWRKTAPNIDRDEVIQTNKSNDGLVLELIRIFKKWNRENNGNILPSYLLETILINFANLPCELNKSINIRFKDALNYIYENISEQVFDLKGIQGNINNLCLNDQVKIKKNSLRSLKIANAAIEDENNGWHAHAIEKWGEIFGSEFPTTE